MADQPDFISKAYNQYGRFNYGVGGPSPEPRNREYQTITVFEKIELEVNTPGNTTVWSLKRLEPRQPVDFLEYCRRKN